jgi:hypothetical protein
MRSVHLARRAAQRLVQTVGVEPRQGRLPVEVDAGPAEPGDQRPCIEVGRAGRRQEPPEVEHVVAHLQPARAPGELELGEHPLAIGGLGADQLPLVRPVVDRLRIERIAVHPDQQTP